MFDSSARRSDSHGEKGDYSERSLRTWERTQEKEHEREHEKEHEREHEREQKIEHERDHLRSIPPSAGHHFTFVHAFLLPVLFDMLVSEIYFLCFPCWCAVQPSFDGFPCLNCNCFIIATRTDPPHPAASPTPETTSTANFLFFEATPLIWRAHLWKACFTLLPVPPRIGARLRLVLDPSECNFPTERGLNWCNKRGLNMCNETSENLGAGETLFSFLRPPFLSVDVDLHLAT